MANHITYNSNNLVLLSDLYIIYLVLIWQGADTFKLQLNLNFETIVFNWGKTASSHQSPMGLTRVTFPHIIHFVFIVWKTPQQIWSVHLFVHPVICSSVCAPFFPVIRSRGGSSHFKKGGFPTQDKGGIPTICPHSNALIGQKKEGVPTPGTSPPGSANAVFLILMPN